MVKQARGRQSCVEIVQWYETRSVYSSLPGPAMSLNDLEVVAKFAKALDGVLSESIDILEDNRYEKAQDTLRSEIKKVFPAANFWLHLYINHRKSVYE